VEDIAKHNNNNNNKKKAQNQNQQLFCSPPLGLLSSWVFSLLVLFSLSLSLSSFAICSSFIIDWLSACKGQKEKRTQNPFQF
jgi:hypothetical protein